MSNTTITTVIKGKTFIFKDFDSCHNGICDIYKLYKRPSSEKITAFNKWKNILDCIYGMEWNSNCFTIYWYITDGNGIEHDVKITRFHNYILYGRRF